MKNWKEVYLYVMACIALTGFAQAENGHRVEGGRTIHAPVTHDNLSVFIISGKDVRATLLMGQLVDPRIMRESTSEILATAMGSAT